MNLLQVFVSFKFLIRIDSPTKEPGQIKFNGARIDVLYSYLINCKDQYVCTYYRRRVYVKRDAVPIKFFSILIVNPKKSPCDC